MSISVPRVNFAAAAGIKFGAGHYFWSSCLISHIRGAQVSLAPLTSSGKAPDDTITRTITSYFLKKNNFIFSERMN
jgi:hypothetical protein